MSDHDTDPLDIANKLQSEANEQALLNNRRREAKRQQAVKAAVEDGEFDGTHCIVCEVEIPAERLAMIHMHCTICATQIEQQKKRTGR